MKVLVVEDNRQMLENITIVLQHHGHEVVGAYSVAKAREVLAVGDVVLDQVVLDLGLPDGDGDSLIPIIREYARENKGAHQYLPILILTARISVESKVDCLNAGADDYLTKPFAMAELIARLNALQRLVSTMHGVAAQIDSERGNELNAGLGIRVDLGAKCVLKEGEKVALPPLQYRLFEYLLENKGHVKSASEIYENVWGDDNSELLFSDTLKVHVAGIRRLLGKSAIKTVKGYGYLVE